MLHSLRELCRYRIRAIDGKCGKADDFYFDDRSFDVRHVVVNTGRWRPSYRVLISPQLIDSPDSTARTIGVSLSKEEMLNLPGSGTDEPVSLRQERLLRQHFGTRLYNLSGAPMGSVHGAEHNRAVALVESDAAPPEEAGGAEQGQLRSAREVIGYKVEAVDGPIGCLEDFLLDDEKWLIAYLVVNTKDVRLPNPRVLAPASWVQHMVWSETRIHMRVNREKIKRSQKYDAASHSQGKPKPFIWP